MAEIIGAFLVGLFASPEGKAGNRLLLIAASVAGLALLGVTAWALVRMLS